MGKNRAEHSISGPDPLYTTGVRLGRGVGFRGFTGLGFMGLGFRVWSLGFRGLGFRGLGFRVESRSWLTFTDCLVKVSRAWSFLVGLGASPK